MSSSFILKFEGIILDLVLYVNNIGYATARERVPPMPG